MKKRIIIAVMALSLVTFAIPAMASPGEDANPRAFLSQQINICRDMMMNMVGLGMISKDQVKACIEMMKSGTCECSGMDNGKCQMDAMVGTCSMKNM